MIIRIFVKKYMNQYKFSYKRASCSGKKRIFAISGGRNRRVNKESVDAFILRNEIAKLNTRRMKGHGAHPFLHMSLRLLPYLHIRTAWEYCFCSFLV